MPYSIVYGIAEPIPANDPVTQSDRVRIYRTEAGTYLGTETTDITHVCGTACLATVLNEQWTPTQLGNVLGAYVCVDGTQTVTTADVDTFTDGTRGNDPYVVCVVCEDEIYRDEAAYAAMYGTDAPRRHVADAPTAEIVTADRQTVRAGSRAFDFYGGKWGTIGADVDSAGWFTFTHDDGTRSTLNGERIALTVPASNPFHRQWKEGNR